MALFTTPAEADAAFELYAADLEAEERWGSTASDRRQAALGDRGLLHSGIPGAVSSSPANELYLWRVGRGKIELTAAHIGSGG